MSPPKVKPEAIPHISFVFTRAMHWHKDSYQALRDIIAYMLATLPEAVTLIAKNYSKGNTFALGRRLTGTNDADWGKYWTNGVSFQAPLPYQIDTSMVQALLHNGALAIELLDDGFVEKQGPLAIADFGVDGIFPEKAFHGEPEELAPGLANGPEFLAALLVATLSASVIAYGLHSLKVYYLPKRSRIMHQDDEETCQLHSTDSQEDEDDSQ